LTFDERSFLGVAPRWASFQSCRTDACASQARLVPLQLWQPHEWHQGRLRRKSAAPPPLPLPPALPLPPPPPLPPLSRGVVATARL
jgi:hypothetical protein